MAAWLGDEAPPPEARGGEEGGGQEEGGRREGGGRFMKVAMSPLWTEVKIRALLVINKSAAPEFADHTASKTVFPAPPPNSNAFCRTTSVAGLRSASCRARSECLFCSRLGSCDGCSPLNNRRELHCGSAEPQQALFEARDDGLRRVCSAVQHFTFALFPCHIGEFFRFKEHRVARNVPGQPSELEAGFSAPIEEPKEEPV